MLTPEQERRLRRHREEPLEDAFRKAEIILRNVGLIEQQQTHEKELCVKTIRQWISDNPWTAVLLSWLFGTTSAVAGCRPDWFWWMVGIFVAGLIVMVFSMMWRMTAPLGLIVALLVVDVPTTNAQEPPPEKGMAGAAVVVVVVGGVCVYVLVRLCQRVFPKTPSPSTNSPPEAIGAKPDTAGSWSYSAPVSCYTPQDDGPSWPQVTMELSGYVEDETTFRLTGSRRMARVDDSQDLIAFQSDLARHGITMGQIGTMYFGRNGKPADEQETPIRFSQAGQQHEVAVYSDSAPSVPLVLQRSFDLKTWTDFGQVSVPIGQPFKVIDTTTGQSAFYRIQPR